MYIRKTFNGSKDYNVYLTESYIDVNGKPKQRIIKRFGLLSKLEAKNPNAYEELRAKYHCKKINITEEIRVSLGRSIKTAKSSVNYGYIFLEQIYDLLQIKKPVINYSKKHKFKYDLNAIIKMLVISRIINPASKKATVKEQSMYLWKLQNKLLDTYRALSHINKIKDNVQMIMHQNVSNNFGRDLSLVLYDLTNYYFETDQQNDLKKPGVSKEYKTNPIVQMGLFIDQNKIPVGYELFPGNFHDSKTMVPMIQKLKQKFGVNRTIVTADKGINSAKNLAHLAEQGDGYIVSQKVRGAKKEFINIVLDPSGYKWRGKNFKSKSITQIRTVKNIDGSKIKLQEKVIIFWSKKFDEREKKKRIKLDEKIVKLLKTPSALKSSNSYGVKRYIKTIKFDPTTGEINNHKDMTIFNHKKYQCDVALDGYYAIVTSETKHSVDDILGAYKELWKIEESFKVIKSDLEGRPVFVRREDHIEGHFLICFIALVILRILEQQLDYQFSTTQIKNDLIRSKCKEIIKGYYVFEPQGTIIQKLESLYETALDGEILPLEKVKSYFRTIKQHKIFSKDLP